jgi:hypothetical protein
MDKTNIPNQIQDFADSAELFRICSKIGGEFNLNLDQIGELDAQIRWVLRGQASATSFSSDIQPLLEIDADKARTITNRINKDVFDTLKNLMEAHTTETSLQAIEQAGGFEIERPMSNIPVGTSLNLLEQKRDIMEGVENPTQSQPTTYPKKEPLVEQLLRGVTAVPEQKVVREAPIATKKPIPASIPPRPTSSDPYREALE